MNCSSAARAALLLLMSTAATADERFSLPIVDKIRKLVRAEREKHEKAIDESPSEHGKAQGFKEGGPKALYLWGVPLATDQVSGAAKAEVEKEEREDAAEPAAIDGIEVSEESAKSPEHKLKAPRFKKGVFEVSQEDETTPVTCKIGQGFCADSRGGGFSLLKLQKDVGLCSVYGCDTTWSVYDCMRVCNWLAFMMFPALSFFGIPSLAGIELKSSADQRDQCFCRFLRPLGCQNPDVCSNPPQRSVGPVAGVRQAAGWDCYATVPDEECTNGQDCPTGTPGWVEVSQHITFCSKGPGRCVDSEGREYDYVSVIAPDQCGYAENTRSYCAEYCVGLPTEGMPTLRGFGYRESFQQCNCFYDPMEEGDVMRFNAGCHGGVWRDNEGTGPVASTLNVLHVEECFTSID